MKIVFSIVLSFSLFWSTVFGNTDFQNLMVGLHILAHSSDVHQHDHGGNSHHDEIQETSHHHNHVASRHHYQNKSEVTASSNLNNRSPFNIVHQHNDDDSHGDGEPHEHVFSMGIPFVSLLNTPYVINLPSLEEVKVLSTPVDLFVQEPYLKGLFRPPIS